MADYTSFKIGELNPMGMSPETTPWLDGMTAMDKIRIAANEPFKPRSTHNEKGLANAVVLQAGICNEQGPTVWPNFEENTNGPKNRYHAICRILEKGDACNLEPNLQRVAIGDYQTDDKIMLSAHQRYYSSPIESMNGAAVNPGDIVSVTPDGRIVEVIKKGPWGPAEKIREAATAARDLFVNTIPAPLLSLWPARNPMDEDSNIPEEALEGVYYTDNPLLAAVGRPYVWGAGYMTNPDPALEPSQNWPLGTRSNITAATAASRGWPAPPDPSTYAPGYDCSGFAQASLLKLGIVPIGWKWPDLNGNSMVINDVSAGHMWSCANSARISNITLVHDLNDMQRGDLLLFGTPIKHVGVVCGPLMPDGKIEMIHAGGSGSGSRCYASNPQATVHVAHRNPPSGGDLRGIIRVRP